MNHFGKYFSSKMFYKILIANISFAMLANFTLTPYGKEKAEYEQSNNNIQLETFNEQENIDQSPVQKLDLEILIENTELIAKAGKEIQDKSEEIITKQQSLRPNKLYYINDNGYSYNLNVEYQDYLWKLCTEYEITDNYELLLSQMYHESQFKSNIISPTNDYGLMQINKRNHEWLSKEIGRTDFLDPYTSIAAGVYMMSHFLNKYHDVQIALVCYNSGESVVQKGTYSTKYSRCVLKDTELLVELED